MTQTSRLVIELDSRDAEAKAADTRKALEALEDAGLSIQPALNKAGAGMEKMGKGAEKATKSIEDETDELERLLGQIDPVVRRLGELDKQEQDLARHRKAGKLDTATYDEYQAKINAARKGITSFDDSLTRTGNTAKQTAAALRGVPAQFTDIATSLQGGQAPLTVFLQQGGQLKDMFGGAGPAAKALGGYVLGLVNPFTVAAAAVGTLGLAYYQGSKEADAYSQALILTGNAAGTSSGAISSMAANVSRSVGTIGAASVVLAQLAGSSKIPASSFEMIATAALKMEDATGKAASQTVADFEKLAKDPVKYSAELNEQLGYLTASTYAQIEALAKQGDQQGAANLAEKAYAEAISSRADIIKSKLGLVETAWDGVKSAAKGAWDAALDVGREDTFEQKLIKLEDRLSRVRNAKTPTIFDDNPNLGELGAGESGAQSAITDLYVQKAEDDRRAAAKTEALRLDKKSIESQGKLNEELKNSASNADKLKARYAEIDELIASASRRGQAYTESQIKQLKDAAAEQYKEKKPTPTKAYTADAGLKKLDAARQTNAVLLQQNASINGQGISTQKLGTQAQALVKWEQQLADIKGKQTLTADQKSLLASQDLITAQLKKNAGLEREAEIQRGIKQANEDQIKLLTLTGQLREANQLNSGLDDAAQMAEYERQGNTEAAKRLETLIKIRDINLNATQKPGTIEGVSQAPVVTGVDASVGGAYSEIERLNEESAKVDAWRTMELQKQQAYLDLKAINEETYAERVNNINQQSQGNQAKIERAKNSAILSSSADFFGNMASLSQLGNKKLAAVGKAAAIAQATIQGYVAVQNALAVQPYPVGMALAVSAGVVAAANVASIAGVGFSGGGYTGDGGKLEPKGVVHGGEFVVRKDVVSQPGAREFLERMNSNTKGYANGGYVGSTSANSTAASQSASSAAPLALPPIVNQIYVNGNPDQDQLARMEESVNRASNKAYERMLNDLKRNGPAMQLIRRNR
ncbi:phage tail length tape measure family protein [Pseudomonas sp. Irchel 3A7]|uniref:phage tail length tape measure family protein n=1 Tax=Pseudomonas sp. Irchel 3A7 TaxID=2008913 RepID=UPI000BA42CD1|nr:phage tail length tape measure family protein [Pseudomonas sp. Irchel 3A7]